MQVSSRIALAAFVLSATTAALYACSSDSSRITDTGNDGGNDSGTPDGTGTGDAGPKDAATDTNKPDAELPPTGCAILDQHDSGRLPELEPPACNQCIGDHCCAKMADCYGDPAAPTDGGYDGSNGVKTLCMLFGECVEKCAYPDGGTNIVCVAQCEVDYGGAAQAQWDDMSDCRTTSCANFCP